MHEHKIRIARENGAGYPIDTVVITLRRAFYGTLYGSLYGSLPKTLHSTLLCHNLSA